MRVKVVEGFQVAHHGKAWRDGDIAEVPADVAAEWVRNGWALTAQPARPPVKAKARPPVRAKAT